MTPGQRLRQVTNVLNATTPLGLLLAGCARTSVRRGPRGLLIATGYRWRLPFAGAFTVGNVVLFRAGPEEALANPFLLAHEERHSTQYAWCCGLPFLPLYFLAAGWSLLRTGNPGSRNVFERHAGLQAGGYPDLGKGSGHKRTRTGPAAPIGKRQHDPQRQDHLGHRIRQRGSGPGPVDPLDWRRMPP